MGEVKYALTVMPGAAGAFTYCLIRAITDSTENLFFSLVHEDGSVKLTAQNGLSLRFSHKAKRNIHEPFKKDRGMMALEMQWSSN